MTITTVSYKRVFSVASYQTETIGMEASLDEGETPEQVLAELKTRTENFHFQTHPEYTPDQTTHVSSQWVVEPEENLSPPQSIISQLLKCDNLDNPNTGLKTWELIVQKNEKQYPEVRVEFDRLLSQLPENQ